MRTRGFKSLLKRYENNPIFVPEEFPYCKADQIFNPGQVIMPDGRTILLVAVIPRNTGFGSTGSGARCYVAESRDGIHFDIWENPIFTVDTERKFGKLDFHPIDCRVTYFAEDKCFYIIRPANSEWGCCALLYKTTDFKTVEPIEIVALPHNRVPCLFPEKISGQYVRLDRPYSVGAPLEKSFGNIWISYSPDLIHWGEYRPLLLHNFAQWNGLKIGPTVPIKTEKGWLEIIHGVRNTFAGWQYSLGAMLLDLKDPSKILGVSMEYILTPETEYEKLGVIPEVVFATGAVVVPGTDELRCYYGGADTTINLATGSVKELVDLCLNKGM